MDRVPMEDTQRHDLPARTRFTAGGIDVVPLTSAR